MILVFAISVFNLKKLEGMIILECIVLLLELFFKEWKLLIRTSLTYIVILLVTYLLNLFSDFNVVAIFLLIFSLMIKIYPLYSLFRLWIYRIPLDEIMISLQRLKIPEYIVLTLVVTIRYMPTIFNEGKLIINNIRMQQTKESKKYYITHLGKFIEMIMVPLLIRSGRISDELADSALTKGYSFDQKLSSITEVKFDSIDIFLCVLIIVINSVLIFFMK